MQPGQSQRRRQWHLEKSVSISHIISTIAIAGSMFVYIGKMDTRIALLEQSNQQQAHTDQRQDAERSESLREIRENMKAISEKLDRLIEAKR